MQLSKITPALVRKDLRALRRGKETTLPLHLLADYMLGYVPEVLERDEFTRFAKRLYALPDTRPEGGSLCA